MWPSIPDGASLHSLNRQYNTLCSSPHRSALQKYPTPDRRLRLLKLVLLCPLAEKACLTSVSVAFALHFPFFKWHR
ncbi:Uncharacterised protein [Vibrio cholerae]|nr:Uncharacterised protein [Vibrio cholerae]